MFLGITKDGYLYQTDGDRYDTKGLGRFATPVDEGSTILSSPSQVLERQVRMDQIEAAKIQKQKARRQQRQVLLGAERRRSESYRILQGQVRQFSGDPMGSSGYQPPATREEKLIGRELMRQKMSGADFSTWERMASNSDFGSRADFEEYSTSGGNPLTRDGNYGAVTDFERIVSGLPFGPPIGTIPSGMPGTQCQNTSMAGRYYNPMGQPARLASRGSGKSMLMRARPRRVMGADDLSTVYALEDTAAQPAQDPTQTYDEFGNVVGSVTYDLAPGQTVTDEFGNVIQSGDATATAAAPASSGPSIWDSLSSALSTPQAQAAIAQGLTSAAKSVAPGATAPAARAPVPSTTVSRVVSTVKKPMSIGILLVIAAGVGFMMMKGRSGGRKAATA